MATKAEVLEYMEEIAGGSVRDTKTGDLEPFALREKAVRHFDDWAGRDSTEIPERYHEAAQALADRWPPGLSAEMASIPACRAARVGLC